MFTSSQQQWRFNTTNTDTKTTASNTAKTTHTSNATQLQPHILATNAITTAFLDINTLGISGIILFTAVHCDCVDSYEDFSLSRLKFKQFYSPFVPWLQYSTYRSGLVEIKQLWTPLQHCDVQFPFPLIIL